MKRVAVLDPYTNRPVLTDTWVIVDEENNRTFGKLEQRPERMRLTGTISILDLDNLEGI